ncbi:MAG: phosphoglycerate kinase [Rhodospirillales bacterium]|nr:phosphoglycerate kinase [Rhodospirillales bacterium]
MSFKTMRDFDLINKTVLLRADLNVPVDEHKNVTDTTRIDRVKPTIDYLRSKGAKIVVLSHFGRPKGQPNDKYSLAFLPPALEKSWGGTILFAENCIGVAAKEKADALQPGDVLLMENLRFHPGEEENNPAFAHELASLGEIYINDAFSAAHRAHASTEAIAHLLPTAAGLLMESELSALNDALENPQKPVMAIVGGSKISTKLDLLHNMVRKVDYLVLGGGMATTFLYAQGHEVGKSLCEQDMADEARQITKEAEDAGCQIILPADRITVEEFGENAPCEITLSSAIPPAREAVDVGPQAIADAVATLNKCKTVLWNGPLGVFEVKPFDKGTNDLARAVAERTKAGDIVSVAGGGDTVAALENAGVTADFSYISTAGGAFLEWLEGKTLPGIAALAAYRSAA